MLGVFAIILSTLFATGKDLVSKGISEEVHGTVSACTSFLFALPWYALILFLSYCYGYSPFEYSGPFFLYVCLRAVTDSFAELFKMHALACGEISFIANFFSFVLGALNNWGQYFEFGIVWSSGDYLWHLTFIKGTQREYPVEGCGLSTNFGLLF